MKPLLLTEKEAERFWSRVDRRGDNECWDWTGGRSSLGYGYFRVAGRTIGAHRIALASTGVDLGSQHALHSCDRPSCCNPAHLRPGTPADNGKDKAMRFRAPSKLNADLVTLIRSRWSTGESIPSIADSLGVNRTTAYFAASGRRWKHL